MSITVRTEDGRVIPIVADSATIGRNHECDVSFPSSKLDGVHAQLRTFGGRWLVEGQGGARIAVGDQPPARMNWLTPGDLLKLSPDGPTLTFCPQEVEGLSTVSSTAEQDSPTHSQFEIGPQPSPPAKSKTDEVVASAVRPSGNSPAFTRPEEMHSPRRHQFAGKPVLISTIAVVAMVLMILLVVVWIPKEDETAGQPRGGNENVAKSAAMKSGSDDRTANVADELLSQRLENNRKSVVWIGVEIQGTRFALCSGCAVSPKQVLSSADIVSQFSEGKKTLGQAQFFVYCPSRKPPFINIQKTWIHPRYLKAKPGDQLRRHYNVAVLSLADRLDHYSLLADVNEVSRLRNGATVLQIGYAFPESATHEYQNGNPPRQSVSKGTITQASSDGVDDDIPNFTLQVAVPKRVDGSPVFNEQGYLVGVLSEIGGKHFAASSPRAQELLTIVRAEAD